MRLVSREMNNAIEADKCAQANFSLVFNKLLFFAEDRGVLRPVVSQNRQPLIDQYDKSKKQGEEILKNHQIQQAEYCQAMEQAGWQSFIFHAQLCSPFISGLGMSHPTETGMVLDHTSGMPYIPAASQKGVLRLAHVINSLIDDKGSWHEKTDLLAQGIVKEEQNKETKETELNWQEDSASKTIFGFSGKKNSQAGQLVVMDAYPLTPPSLGEEILNPHFTHYYGGERGPTEDQSPIPVKFLVLKPGAEFIFRLLLRRPLNSTQESNRPKLAKLVEENFKRAIKTEGIGAKTALGFGRFELKRKGEPERISNWLQEKKYPWRSIARKLEAAKDWSQLKQEIKKEDFQKYQDKPEIGIAIEKTAKLIKQKNLKKWDKERDKKVIQWLTPAGIAWEVSVAVTESSSLSSNVQSEIDSIKKLADWGSWQNFQVSMETLSPPALELLRVKFKDFGCNGKKVNKAKKQAWKKLTKLIRETKKGPVAIT